MRDPLLSEDAVDNVLAYCTGQKTRVPLDIYVPTVAENVSEYVTILPITLWVGNLITAKFGADTPSIADADMGDGGEDSVGGASASGHWKKGGGKGGGGVHQTVQKRGGAQVKCVNLMKAYKNQNWKLCDTLIKKYEEDWRR